MEDYWEGVGARRRSLPAVAQAPPPIDLITIGKVCAGSTSGASAPNARGKYTDANGFEFEFGSGGNAPVTVTRDGQLLYKIEKFTAQDYLTCMKEMAETLSRPPIPAQKSCRIPENGIELEYLCFYWRMLRPFVCVTDGQDGLNRHPPPLR
jgi:hypothetical protein